MSKPANEIPDNLEIVLKNLDILPKLECFIYNDYEAGKIIDKDLTGLNIEYTVELLKEYLFVEVKNPFIHL